MGPLMENVVKGLLGELHVILGLKTARHSQRLEDGGDREECSFYTVLRASTDCRLEQTLSN